MAKERFETKNEPLATFRFSERTVAERAFGKVGAVAGAEGLSVFCMEGNRGWYLAVLGGPIPGNLVTTLNQMGGEPTTLPSAVVERLVERRTTALGRFVDEAKS